MSKPFNSFDPHPNERRLQLLRLFYVVCSFILAVSGGSLFHMRLGCADIASFNFEYLIPALISNIVVKILQVRFHPLYSDILASGSLDHEVRLWDAKTAECIGSRDFCNTL